MGGGEGQVRIEKGPVDNDLVIYKVQKGERKRKRKEEVERERKAPPTEAGRVGVWRYGRTTRDHWWWEMYSCVGLCVGILYVFETQTDCLSHSDSIKKEKIKQARASENSEANAIWETSGSLAATDGAETTRHSPSMGAPELVAQRRKKKKKRIWGPNTSKAAGQLPCTWLTQCDPPQNPVRYPEPLLE